jgi:DNA-directed RNA polymerase subunit RPC12/RpoP
MFLKPIALNITYLISQTMITTPIKVKCKKCGRDVKSDEFILDPIYKMMVCKDCVKERKANELNAKKTAAQAEFKAKQEVQQKNERPAGWDSEDAEIERAYKAKQGSQPRVEKIDEEKVKYTCAKCKYEFIFNTYKRMPGRCPYCSTPVNF